MNDTINMDSLLERISQDDPQAFKVFYEYTYPRLYRIACYFLSDSEARKDVLSEVYMNFWRYRRTLKDIRNIDNYLFILVRNHVIRANEEKVCSQHVRLEESGLEDCCVATDPEKEMLNNELREIIELTVNSLPDRCRLIFLMVREEGLKYKDVAEMLSISEKTVQSQMVIAVKKIGTVVHNYRSSVQQVHK